jgi:LacI family transcriptional regulator
VWNVRYQRGIEARAADLGFAVDVLRFEVGAADQIERLSQVVRSRGLRGLLVLPVHGQTSLASFNFGHLAAATIDVSLRHPALHRASPDYFQGMQLALDVLRARRRRRIGFCTFCGEVRRIGSHWKGAFLGWQSDYPADERVAPHVSRFDERQNGEGAETRWDSHRDAFAEWIAAEKPDAIVSNDLFFLDWLRELGHAVPDDIAFALLSLDPDNPSLAGIDQNAERVGAAAVDLIVEQIHRNEYGLPLCPKTVLVPGVWVDGATLQ